MEVSKVQVPGTSWSTRDGSLSDNAPTRGTRETGGLDNRTLSGDSRQNAIGSPLTVFGVRRSGFGVWGSEFCHSLFATGWRHMALTNNPGQTLNPIRSSCPLCLCGEIKIRSYTGSRLDARDGIRFQLFSCLAFRWNSMAIA